MISTNNIITGKTTFLWLLQAYIILNCGTGSHVADMDNTFKSWHLALLCYDSWQCNDLIHWYRYITYTILLNKNVLLKVKDNLLACTLVRSPWQWMEKSEIFLHDRPWISPWIKSISNELDINIHVIVIVTSSAIVFDVISRMKADRVRHGDDV